MRSQPRRIVEQRAHELGHVVEVELPHHDRAAGVDEMLRVQRLVVAGRERVRHEDRRPAGGGDLPDASSPERDEHEVDGRERGAEALGLGEHAVVVAPHAAPDERRSRGDR